MGRLHRQSEPPSRVLAGIVFVVLPAVAWWVGLAWSVERGWPMVAAWVLVAGWIVTIGLLAVELAVMSLVERVCELRTGRRLNAQHQQAVAG